MANQLSANNIRTLERLGVAQKFLNLHTKVKITRNIKEYKNLMEQIENHKKAIKTSYKLVQTALRKMMHKHLSPVYPGFPDPSYRFKNIGFPSPFAGQLIQPNNIRRQIANSKIENENVQMFVHHYNRHKNLTRNMPRIGQELLALSRKLIQNSGQIVPQNNAAILQKANNLFYNINVNRGRRLRNRAARAHMTKKLRTGNFL